MYILIGLTINFIPGHTPTLYIRQDGSNDIAETIDVSSYTTDQLVNITISLLSCLYHHLS
jgi:hypothetical protein